MFGEFTSRIFFYFVFTYIVIRKERFFILGGRKVAESFKWLFIDFVPLLYEKKRVARQLQVEAWLDLFQFLKELKIEKLEESKRDKHVAMSYIV